MVRLGLLLWLLVGFAAPGDAASSSDAVAAVTTTAVARYDSSSSSDRDPGRQREAVPVFPRTAEPAAEFSAVLELARGSASREAVADIEEGKYGAALAKLEAFAGGEFHWRGEVTNGYQQGFFLYALRGYCLETLGEVVKAYRSYQNSRGCYDEETVVARSPEPRLEVFLGLGRTCNEAGRYTDAYGWLDVVRLEASGVPRLAAAADRGLIRRAVEIGDYHDALTSFWDLQAQLAKAGAGPAPRAAADRRR
jgi:tetratricopeptide (TPR) repeat protein